MLTITATELPRIMQCQGSLKMSPAFPNMDGDRTNREEGIAAHWAAKEIFDGRTTMEEISDRKAPNGIYITADMAAHVEEYLSSLDCGEMEWIGSLSGNNWSVRLRPDHIAFSDGKLTVDDFKYGHRPVSPEMNWTLISYALAWIIDKQQTLSQIELRIHQPRGYHPDGKLRTWSVSYAELLELYQRIDVTLSSPSDTVNTGPSCVHCPSLANCPAARAATYNAIDASDIVFDDSLPNDALSQDLDLLEQAMTTIKHRYDAMCNLAEHRINQGQPIHNRAIDTQYANRRWKTGITAAMVQAVTGIDVSKPGIGTPAEAERRGIPKAVLASFVERPMTGTKLIRVDTAKRAARLLDRKE